jgi:hypothetical protein
MSPRGGKRSGKPGAQYANRSDLRAPGAPDIPKVPQGQPYGAAGQQTQALAAAPAQGPPGVPTPPSPAPGGPPPGSFGDFGRPTERPNEPITHGAPLGPGAGTEILPTAADNNLNLLRSIYRNHPSQALEQIIEEMSSRGSA